MTSLRFFLPWLIAAPALALSLPPSGENQRSTAVQQIGPVTATIEYSGPRVTRGKVDRRGKIWGQLVPYGLAELDFNGACKKCPWRAGATLMTLSRAQAASGRAAEAEKTFDKAIAHPTARPIDVHQAGRRLQAEGKKDAALKVFQANAARFPGQWPVRVGLMRGYAAVGDFKKALDEGRLAREQAPDAPNRKNLERLVGLLEQGKDID